MKQKLPIGLSDFRQLRQEGLYYVDKTLLAQEVVESSKAVILLPRPRRFGKTLNLSMLRYFFDAQEDHSALFEGLAITQTPQWQSHQGKYPVLFITFRSVSGTTLEAVWQKIREMMEQVLTAHDYLLDSPTLKPYEKAKLTRWLSEPIPQLELSGILEWLMARLHRHYGKPVVVLVDEYDLPIILAHQQGFYAEIISFMRGMLSGIFKDNNHLYRGVITGILRVAKESIFSGLNNLTTHTILDTGFHTRFGLTPQEVKKLLADFDRSREYEEVARWYNGYLFGNEEMYNPWSILQYLANPDWGFYPHWVNTSGNELIQKLLQQDGSTAREGIAELMQGKAVVSELQRFTVFQDLDAPTPSLLYSFLVFSGYLKAAWHHRDANHLDYYSLTIPNLEVNQVYLNTFMAYLGKMLGDAKVPRLLNALLTPDVEAFAQLLKGYVANAFSYHDVPAQEPERVYHGFMLGLLAHLSGTHIVQSNRETGFGRADLLIIPREAADKRGYVLELKKATEAQDLNTVAQEALQQATHQAYTQALKDHGKTQLHHLAIAFRGKEVYAVGTTEIN